METLSPTILIAIGIGFFILVAILIAVFGKKKGKKTNVDNDSTFIDDPIMSDDSDDTDDIDDGDSDVDIDMDID